MNKRMNFICGAALVLMAGVTVWAQSSSLYVIGGSPARLHPASPNSVNDRLSPHISKVSISAVRPPEPRQFAIHDLVTIIVRESIENASDSELNTEKEVTLSGVLKAFPNLQLSELSNLQLRPSTMSKGIPKVDLKFKNEFDGDGEYDRKDTFTTRITARIIDVKPNGTLILEARKFIRSDEESVNIVLTGTCRKDDVAADNTILSTLIYDMRLVKEHEGEVRNASKKGLITKFFDLLFNF